MARRTPSVYRTLIALTSLLLLTAAPALGQRGGRGGGAPTLNAPTDARLQGFRWRSIGPVAQGGRIHTIDAVDSDPNTFYLGFATGGLWKTSNNGISFELLFPTSDDHHTHSIGSVAIAPSNPNIIYVGTGEPCNRQSSSFGTGIYKSTDGGRTFTHLGLRETQTVGRVVVHPTNPNIVWVAALGSLWASTPDRGVFMSTDGGQTWNKTLYIDEHTGVTDLVVDRSNPNTLFAATYQRQRSNWGFIGGGPGSGIHTSTDGGRTWRKLSGSGLPGGALGRIGLAISRSNPNVVYAQIETYPTDPAPAGQAAAGRGGRAGGGGGGGGRGGQEAEPDPTRSGVWRSADKGRSWTFQSNENNRPMYYSHIMVDPSNENTVYIGGLNAMKSTDGGRTWENIQNNGVGHVDNHAIWIAPDGKKVLYGNDGSLAMSYDAGQSFDAVRLWAVGQPYHASVDMRRPYWVCTGLQDNGSWCGPSSMRSGTIRMWNWISVGGGDGFQTQVDPTDHRVFYTESQNGNIRRYDLNDGTSAGIRPAAGGGGRGGGGGGGGGGRGGNIVPQPPDGTEINYNWNSPIRISPHNPRTILFGGNRLFISRDRGETWTMTEPLGKDYDESTRSMMGISYNLPSCGRGGGGGQCIPSKNDGLQNNEARTIIEIAESPIVPGIYWVGTADGNIQVSRDGGATWTEVSGNLPGGTRDYWVSGLEASWYEPGTAYASYDGHHSNDLRPYVFKTTDYGATWTSISGNLPTWGNVNTIRQDPVNRNLLYAATEFGFYITLDEGRTWQRFMPNLPTVRADEVVVHPRENDLILATHGRSVWVLDDVTALQQMTNEATQREATLFAPRDAVAWKSDPRENVSAPGMRHWAGENAPRGTAIAYHLRSAASGEVRVVITNLASGEAVRTCIGTGNQGLNRFQWTLSGDPAPDQGGGGGRGGGGRGGAGAGAAPATPPGPPPITPCTQGGGGGGGRGGGGGGGGIGPGAYRVTLSIAGREVGSQTFNVLEDIWLNVK